MSISLEKKDRYSALLVYLELMRNTDENNYISSRNLEKDLEKKYGKENRPSHNVIAEVMKQLEELSDELDIDIKRGKSNQGYCIEKRYFEQNEIALFVEGILESKSLLNWEKIDLVEKLADYLGPSHKNDFDYLYNYMDFARNNSERLGLSVSEIGENDEKLRIIIDAIVGQKTVFLGDMFGLDCVSPYRVFSNKGSIYVLYGIMEKEELVLDYKEINSFKETYIVDGKYVPFQKAKGFENEEINEVELRKNPFEYIRRQPKDTVIVEVLPYRANTPILSSESMSDNLIEGIKRYFGKENVETLHQREKILVSINDYIKNVIEYFLQPGNFSYYKIVSPEKAVEQVMLQIATMYVLYDTNMDDKLKEERLYNLFGKMLISEGNK